MLYVQNVFKLFFFCIITLCIFEISIQNVFASYSEHEFQSLTTDKERSINKIRDAEIQQLSSILRRETQSEKKIDILLRLGRIYTEKYKHYFYKENQIWKRKVDAQLSNTKGKSKEVLPDHGRSKKVLGRSLSRLQQLLSIVNKSRKRIKGLDEFYYYLGFSYWESGQRKNANTQFKKIIKNYPGSRYVAEAYRYVADYAFRSRKFSEAKRYFQKAAIYRKLPTYSRVLYSLAWTEYKIGNNRSALEYMKKAIIASQTFDQNDAIKRGYALDRDAYDALALFYSEARSYKNATNYFRTVVENDKNLYEVLHRLLVVYQNQGHYAKAVAIGNQLERLDGGSVEQSVSKKFEILNAALKSAKIKRQHLKEKAIIKKMVVEFIDKKVDDEGIIAKVKDIVRNVAIYNHGLIKSGNRSRLVLSTAAEFYTLYINAFSNNLTKDEYYEARYLLADVYLKWKRYKKSIAEYRFLLDEALKSSNNRFILKHKKDIAKGLIYSSDVYLKNKKRNYSKKELDDLLATIGLYEKVYPGTPESLQFLSRAAGLLKNDKSKNLEYEKRLRYFIDKYPSSPQAMESAVLLIEKAEKEKKLEKLLGYTEEFLNNSKLMRQDKKGKFKRDLQKIQPRVQFQLVKAVENKKDFLKAAKSYERLFVKSADKEVREKALNNAAINYEKAGDAQNASRIYRLLLTSYSKFRSHAAERIIANADYLFISKRYELALAAYSDFYTIYKNRMRRLRGKEKQLVIRALKNKFLLEELLQGEEGLKSSINELLNLSRTTKFKELYSLLEELLYRSATMDRQAEKNINAIRSYKRYLQFFRNGNYSIEATVQLGLLYREIKELGVSRNYFVRASRLYRTKRAKISNKEKSFAALARLERLHNLEISYKNIVIRLPESRLQKDIQRKLSSMERLNKGYLEVLDYGDGKWSLEAIYRTALSYLEFADTLKNIPVPKSYNKEKEAKLRAQIQSIVKPVLQKVTETFSLAMKRGNSLVVADPVMAKVYITSSLYFARKTRYPLAYELDWEAKKWIVGTVGTDKDIQILLNDPKKLSAIVAVGNYHLMKGNELLAKVFYNRAISVRRNYSAAINNLAYIEGKNGDTQAALAGFKQALKGLEFNKQIRKNIGKVYMASGLWRHARLVYRRLSTYVLDDREMSRGLGFSYLALGQLQQAKELLEGNLGNDTNSQFAKAVLELAKGDEKDAKSVFRSLESRSSYAKIVTKFWKN